RLHGRASAGGAGRWRPRRARAARRFRCARRASRYAQDHNAAKMIRRKGLCMKVLDANPPSPELTRRIGGVIVTHGHLATEFIAAAEMIIGPIPHVTPVSIDWHDDADVARQELERAIARVSQGRGVLLLTDMF